MMKKLLALLLLTLPVLGASTTYTNSTSYEFLVPLAVKELTYTDTYWDDSTVPALAITGGATAPGLIAFNGSSIVKIYGFDGGGTPDDGQFSIQMSHRIKAGGQLEPHVHWCRTADPTDPAYTNVVWRLVYSMADVNGVFHPEVTVLATNSISGTNWFHQVTDFGTITNMGSISQIMVGNISRRCDDPADTYDQDAGFLGLDIHYETDSPGSREEYVK